MYRRFLFDETSSTNDRARAYASEGRVEPAVFIARQQSAGRGRMGHSFLSPTGGLYMSLLSRPTAKASLAVRLTIFAATVAARVLEELTGEPVRIKWVNDLYMRGKKVGGILTEGSCQADGSLAFAIVGIGINLAHVDFPEELCDIATTVEDAAGVRLCADEVADRIATAFFATDPFAEEIIDDYRRRCFVVGQRVSVLRADTSYEALAIGITDSGSLIVRLPSGQTEELSSGDVRVRPQKV